LIEELANPWLAVFQHAKLLEDRAADLEQAADSNRAEAPELMRRAEQLAATEHATVEAAEHAQHLTAQQIQDQDAAALAADTASTTGQREPGAVRHRATLDAARGAVKAVGAELELRARMPAGQCAREEEVRAQATSEKRAAKQAAADKRAAQQQRQQNQGQNRTGGVR
jgi:hypothetical protein